MRSGDYISREALLSATEGYDWKEGLKTVLKRIPAADVRPVMRGRWKDDWETGCSECSACHDTFLWEDHKGVADWNFCPNCGADMRPEPPKEEE